MSKNKCKKVQVVQFVCSIEENFASCKYYKASSTARPWGCWWRSGKYCFCHEAKEETEKK